MKKLLTMAILCFSSIFAIAAVTPTASSNSNSLTPLKSKIIVDNARETTSNVLTPCTKTVTVEFYSASGVFIKSFTNTATSSTSCSAATTSATNTGKKQAEDYAAAQGLGPITWPPPTVPD